MGSYLSIAAVTATLARSIAEALDRVPTPSGAARVRYRLVEEEPAFVGCTLVLYGVRTNSSRGNDGLPTRNHAGDVVAAPRVALEADYLLAFSGDESTLEPQRFLGSVVTALHGQPVIGADAIRQTIASTPYLQGADLDPQIEPIRLAPRTVAEETLRQIWGLFPGEPYRLSIVYTASPIVLDSRITPIAIPAVTAGRSSSARTTARP